MLELVGFENVGFLNFEDKEEVRKFVFGDGVNPAEPLYKYIVWTNAKKTMEKRYIWMSNPIVWEDPFEKYFFNAQYEDSTGGLIEFPFKNKVFCNCLTLDNNSEAHWVTYSKSKFGVSLRINVEELVMKLNLFGKYNPSYKIFLGKVSYLKQSQIQARNIFDIPLYEDLKGRPVTRNINEPEFCANLMLLKRKAFKHDNEVRLIIIHEDNKDELTGIEFQYNYDDHGGLLSDYPNENLINRVFTSPFYGVDKRDKIRKELEKKKYGLNPYIVNYKSGKTAKYSRIQRSRLYDTIKSKKILLYK